MKKSNIITLLSLVVLLIAVIIFMALKPALMGGGSPSGQAGKQDSKVAIDTGGNTDSDSDGDSSVREAAQPKKKITASVDDALFIGDSRTVGLSEYSAMNEADFFSNVGMSVYNIYDKTVSVPKVGKVTLEQLLNNKKYAKIYVMLGINEVGYDIGKTTEKYKELVEFIKDRQPKAKVFIQANLHVTKGRSDRDKVVNNANINQLNKSISRIADNKKVFYMDVNQLFDDGYGNLSKDKSDDDTHLYAKHYIEWGKWIREKTGDILGEE